MRRFVSTLFLILGVMAPQFCMAAFVSSDVQSPTLIRKVSTVAALRATVGGPAIKASQLLGYYAEGDGGGGPVRYWDAASTCADDGGACIDPSPIDANPGRWIFDAQEIDARAYGYIGDGVVDDQPALQNYATYCGTAGLTFLVLDGTGFLNSQLTIPEGVPVDVRGTLTSVGAVGSFPNFGTVFVGSTSPVNATTGSIAADITAGDTSFTVTSATGISAGDVLVLWDSNVSSYSTWRTNYYKGEYVKVLAVSGTTIEIGSPFFDSYVAANTGLYELTQNTAPVYALRVIGSDSISSGVIFSGYHATTLKGVDARGGEAAAITLTRCFDVEIFNGLGIQTATTGGSNYGLSISNSQTVISKGGYYYGYRHGTATGGDADTGSVPCRKIVFDGVTVINDSVGSGTHAADFHGNTELSEYRNCTIRGGATLQGRKNRYVGNDIYQDGFVTCVYGAEIVEFDYIVEGNRFYLSDSDDLGRGRIIDFGGNTSPFSVTHTVKGGTLFFRGNKTIHYDAASIVLGVNPVVIRNTGYIGDDLNIVFEDNEIVIPDIAKSVYQQLAMGSATSGDVFNTIEFNGNIIYGAAISLTAQTIRASDIFQGGTNGNDLVMPGFSVFAIMEASLENIETSDTSLSGVYVDAAGGRADLANIRSKNACRVYDATTANRVGVLISTAGNVYADNIKVTSENGTAVNITNAVDNGAGLIRITAVGHGLVTNNGATITGVVGTTEANGVWTITRIDDNTIDLQGSTFTNAYVSGGTVATSVHPSAIPYRFVNVTDGKVGSWVIQGYPTSVISNSGSTLTAMSEGP